MPGELVEFDLAGELMLYRPETGRILALNATAALIWRGGLSDASPAERLRRLQHTLGVSAEQVQRDHGAVLESIQRFTSEAIPRVSTGGARTPLERPASLARIVTLELAGRRLRLHGPPQLWPRLRPAFDHLVANHEGAALDCWVDNDGSGWTMAAADHTFFRHLPDAELGPAMVRAMGTFAGSQDRWSMLLHAAGVRRHGRTLLLPAPGGRGKSTLAAALMHAGWDFWGDDVLAVESEWGRLWPLPLPLSLKQGSWPVLADRLPEIAGLTAHRSGGQAVKLLAPLGSAGGAWQRGHRVAAVVCPQYRPDAPLHLRPSPPREVLSSLFSGSSFICRQNAEAVRSALEWAASLPGYRLTYSDLHAAQDALENLAQQLPCEE